MTVMVVWNPPPPFAAQELKAAMDRYLEANQ